MARGLSDLQKSVLKSGLEVEIKHRHSLWRKRLRRVNDTLPMADIVALAGAGEQLACFTTDRKLHKYRREASKSTREVL